MNSLLLLNIPGGDWLLLIGAVLLFLAGLIGCIIPALPGPPIAYTGLILFNFTETWQIKTPAMIWLGAFTVIVTILDYLVPIYGTKKFGGSKYGTWGAALGVIVGMFFGPPGIIIGPFAGAVIGELISGKDNESSLRAGFGSFLGFLAGTMLKVFISLFMIFVFLRNVF